MAAENLCVLPRLNEAQRYEYWASLALRHCRGLGIRSIRRLLDHYGSASAAVDRVSDWGKLNLTRQSQGITSDAWRVTAKDEWDAARRLEGEVLLWTDPRYPHMLRELPDAPVLLYLRGRTTMLEDIGIGVVGTRKCSARGRRDAHMLAGGLASMGLVVVSGLAGGVDSVAHTAALHLPGGTIAVLGTGLDIPYPAGNAELYANIAEYGLLVSEFAPGTPPEARNFPIRNRIISGLSMGVLVVEASPRSGSLITARLALEQNRAVYAVAGDIGDPRSEGCQELIRQGAQPIFGAGDILSDLRAVLLHRGDARLRIDLPPDQEEVQEEVQEAVQEAVQKDAQEKTENVSETISANIPANIPEGRDSTPPTLYISPTKPAAAPPVPKKTLPSPPATHQAVASPDVELQNALSEKISAGPEALLTRRILALLAQSPHSIDQIVEQLSLPAGEISAELVILEVRRCVRRLPDTRYALYD